MKLFNEVSLVFQFQLEFEQTGETCYSITERDSSESENKVSCLDD